MRDREIEILSPFLIVLLDFRLSKILNLFCPYTLDIELRLFCNEKTIVFDSQKLILSQ